MPDFFGKARRARKQRSQQKRALETPVAPVHHHRDPRADLALHVPVPIEHPVVQTVGNGQPFRVLRLARRPDGVHYELLGEFAKSIDAMVFCNRERWRAIVDHWRGGRVYDNWRESKPPET
jgi:hypothetical protein